MGTEPAPDYPAHWEADVVLRDGGTAQIRPIGPEDADRLVAFYERVSDESKYFRFFAPYPRLSDKDVHRFTHHDYVDRVGLAAVVGEQFIATVRYDRIAPTEAEVAFLVQDEHQGRGVASALMEHIAACARERGIRRFAAEVLPGNTKMIKVFTDAGYTQKRTFEDGVVRLEFDLEPTEKSVAVMRAREQRAEARSVQRLLSPGSVAVVGTGRRPGGVGRTVLRNLLDGGFGGAVYAVNRALEDGRQELEGVPAHRSVRDIAGPVDLAVVAVPPAEVPSVVADCGEHGVQGLVVLTAGYADEPGDEGRTRQRELVRQVRSYGMRLIGPNAFGLVQQAGDVRLNASLAPTTPLPGRTGVFTQSGAIGIALLTAMHRRAGAGVSTFVSAGNRADVSGNDFLQFWHDDPGTDVVLMYLESIGNPRKFTRLAKRTAAQKPVVVVKGARHTGSSPAGHAVPATGVSPETVSELLGQAGVIRADTVTELVDTGLLLATQPLPAGPRVAIVGNSESLGLLTYDACLAQGLRPQLPRDLGGGAGPADFRQALASVLADDACDAVVVTAIPWVADPDLPALAAAPGPQDAESLAEALRAGLAEAVPAKPVAVVSLALEGLAESLASGAARTIPAYDAAEGAARALASAVRYAMWRRDEAAPGRVPELDDVDETGAAADIERALADRAEGEVLELDTDAATALLARYGIPVLPVLPAPDPDTAAAAATRLGYPVALKTTAAHLRHRPDLGGVRLDLADEGALRRAHDELTQALGKSEELHLVVQAMAPRGVDTVVRATVEPSVGAVLSFGLSGAPSELLGDVGHRLVPVTDREAAALVRSIRAAPLLFGWRGADAVDTPSLEELLLRVSLLVDDHPEVVGVELTPVVVATQGAMALSATVRLAQPPPRTDLGPRTLPSY
ncbi:GNAT family N-acetyltransferase [Streptomyces sp. A7024]|uniref:GNAT family N-acetyltransferase n=1 Tax=Streptomyces coryli TaxID=1128680 RepID=A0A6G4U1E2_9ACTN|nr:bifunctional GNAT family N-acetyltransferase/acetate--CoA ligase family protein [Streptomyces coryli]NGN65097.1 GNAT family N-acetyltransferase [Streptomyces coryli]